MTNIATKYSIGDICYIVIHPTADILQCTVEYVRVVPGIEPVITYKVLRTDTAQSIDYVHEDEVYTFSEAKTELLGWLNDQTMRISGMIEPPPPQQR